ncbi:unnamed protein product [Pedinophyceae sp. YPF-701]|nr:unnamed protein product [Pedinophyceae sp. YPF-701]
MYKLSYDVEEARGGAGGVASSEAPAPARDAGGVDAACAEAAGQALRRRAVLASAMELASVPRVNSREELAALCWHFTSEEFYNLAEDRAAGGKCGWPLCSAPCQGPRKPTLHVSVAQQKFYATGGESGPHEFFCGTQCHVDAAAFAASLGDAVSTKTAYAHRLAQAAAARRDGARNAADTPPRAPQAGGFALPYVSASAAQGGAVSMVVRERQPAPREPAKPAPDPPATDGKARGDAVLVLDIEAGQDEPGGSGGADGDEVAGKMATLRVERGGAAAPGDGAEERRSADAPPPLRSPLLPAWLPGGGVDPRVVLLRKQRDVSDTVRGQMSGGDSGDEVWETDDEEGWESSQDGRSSDGGGGGSDGGGGSESDDDLFGIPKEFELPPSCFTARYLALSRCRTDRTRVFLGAIDPPPPRPSGGPTDPGAAPVAPRPPGAHHEAALAFARSVTPLAQKLALRAKSPVPLATVNADVLELISTLDMRVPPPSLALSERTLYAAVLLRALAFRRQPALAGMFAFEGGAESCAGGSAEEMREALREVDVPADELEGLAAALFQ